MKKFAKFFITKPTAVCLTALLIVAVGFFAAFFMPKALLPESNTSLIVTLSCPDTVVGAMESDILLPAETAINALDGVKQTTSRVSDNCAEITVRLDGADEDSRVSASVWIRLSTLELPGDVSVRVKHGGDEFMTLAVLAGKYDTDDLCLKLARIKGVERVETADCTYDSRPARKICVYASTKDAEGLAKNLNTVLTDSDLVYRVLYDYGDSVAHSAALSAIIIILALLAAFIGLFVYLKRLPAILSALCSVIVSAMLALALMWASGMKLFLLSAGGFGMGIMAAVLVTSALTVSLSRADSAVSDETCAARTASAAPMACDAAAVFIFVMLPLCFVNDDCAQFAIPCLFVGGLSLISSLTLLPCIYRLCGRLSKGTQTSGKPKVKSVTARELKLDDEIEKSAPILKDYTIPSLDDIARLNRKAKRAVLRTRFIADRPLMRLRKGYERALSAVSAHRILALILIIVLFAGSCALSLLLKTSPVTGAYSQCFTVTVSGDALNYADEISAVNGVTDVLSERSDDFTVFTVKAKSNAKSCAEKVKNLIVKEFPQPVISLKDDALFPRAYTVEGADKDTLSSILIAFGTAMLLAYFYCALRLGGALKALALAASLLPTVSGGLLIAALGAGINLVTVLGLASALCFTTATSLRTMLLCEYAVREGYDVVASSKASAGVNLKRVFYTFMTFALVLAAMCFTFGSGLTVLRPFALTALGGALLGTAVMLFALPSMFSLVRRSRPLLALEAPVYDLEMSGIEIEIATPAPSSENLPAKRQ